MNIIIEDVIVKSLKVGDVLMKGGKLFFVVDNRDGICGEYSIKGALQYSGAMLTDRTLDILTASAITHGYKPYYQDEYDLVIRKK